MGNCLTLNLPNLLNPEPYPANWPGRALRPPRLRRLQAGRAVCYISRQ